MLINGKTGWAPYEPLTGWTHLNGEGNLYIYYTCGSKDVEVCLYKKVDNISAFFVERCINVFTLCFLRTLGNMPNMFDGVQPVFDSILFGTWNDEKSRPSSSSRCIVLVSNGFCCNSCYEVVRKMLSFNVTRKERPYLSHLCLWDSQEDNWGGRLERSISVAY